MEKKLGVIVTTHARMFKTADGKVWTNGVYDYNFFTRYIKIFTKVCIITRIKKIEFSKSLNLIRVDGPGLFFLELPFYVGPFNYFRNLRQINKVLSSSLDDFDSAILRLPDQIAFKITKKFILQKKKFIVEVVSDSWDLFKYQNYLNPINLLLKYYWHYQQKFICKKAVGVSYVTQSYIQKRYPSNIIDNSKRFHTFYTSADLPEEYFFRPRVNFQDHDGVFRLVIVAGLNNHLKGHFILFKSLYLLKKTDINFQLKVIGGGILINKMINYVKKLKLENKVDFLGHISSSPQIRTELINSDIFVLPSFTEGLPRALIEAMALGLPCIASNVGGIPELLESISLVPSNSSLKLKSKLYEFMSNRNLLISLSAQNFLKAKEYSRYLIEKKRNSFYSEYLFSLIEKKS